MSLQVFASQGNSVENLITNLKLALALEFYQPSSKLVAADSDDSKVLLKSKTLELIEPNAVVKFLASAKDSAAFSKSDSIILEETKIWPYKSLDLQSLNIADSLTQVEKIILFASLFPFVNGKSELPAWFQDFAKLTETTKAVTVAQGFTKVERQKETNTGAQSVKEGHQVISSGDVITPTKEGRNILITSALPYVNNVPHLGNIVGSVLSADIYSRFCKNRNYTTLFICGTDEYGTATETKALEEKVSPRDLCNKYHAIHSDVYKWFQIGFDYFGRTTTEKQTEIAQDIFLKLHQNGYIERKTMKQLYCPVHNGFLADRYVEGECPKCQYEDARGDQCDKCGNLLNPFELINPRCKLDSGKPEPRESEHCFLSLDKLEPEVKEWVLKASEKGDWSKNSKTITNSWLSEGLEPRCITRDLVWGTPVPLKDFEDKVLYVWFDAPIGYISITANYAPEHWKEWWKNPDEVDLYQFMGKDNVPFHTVVFPASELGTKEPWTMLHHLSTTEYLQYEGGKFSKSRNVGVFGNNAEATGVPPSVWRYYLASVRPESSDSQFSWDDFVARNNNELLANLGNFVNRLTKFVVAKYNGVIPKYDVQKCENYDSTLQDVNKLLASYVKEMEAVHLKRGLEIAMAISSRGNQFLQENKLDNSLYENTPEKCDAVVAIGLNLIYLVSSIISPYMPETSSQINEILNAPPLKIGDTFEMVLQAGHCIGKPQYLFKRIDEKKISEWRSKYGGGSG